MHTKKNNLSVAVLKFVLPLFVIVFAHAASEAQAPENSTFCANDFQKCNFDGDREVIYGANGVFVRKVIKGGSVCLPDTFGVPDPVPNVLKSCYVVNAAEPAASEKISRTITLKNNSGMAMRGRLISRGNYDDPGNRDFFKTSLAGSPVLNLGQTGAVKTIPVNLADDIELQIVYDPGFGRFEPVFAAKLPNDASVTNFCYELTGTVYVPYVKTCDGSATYESPSITFKNEAGYNATMSLNYYPTGSSDTRTLSTETISPGYQRKIYLPMVADTAKAMTLKVVGSGTILKNDPISVGAFGTTCLKTWGSIFSPKISPCSASTSARTIKLKNNGAFQASMWVTYDDNGTAKSVRSNPLEVLESDTVEVPSTGSRTPITLSFRAYNKEFNTATVPGNFTGELCYKLEGTAFAPTSATCDDTIGDTSGKTRQIRFQNDAGYDAQMIVMYFVDETINGVKVPMAKTLATGMINGLGAKFRLVTIPKDTAKGMPITVSLQGSTTLKNDIFSINLPANFAASPQQCFKVTGTLFDPKGGKCDQ